MGEVAEGKGADRMSDRYYEMIRDKALRLAPEQQLELIADLTRKFRENYTPPPRKPGKSLRGICKDLGPVPSDEEIAEARRELWGNFASEEIV